MVSPIIKYYARLDFDVASGKTPKYVITKAWGFYEPMEQLKGKNGKVSMYLMPKREQQSSNCPPMHLQAKGSLNFTGLKDFFVDGKLSGYAFGYPPSEPTYSAKILVNPFFQSREDGFLFIVHQCKEARTPAEQQRPNYIEMLVLDGCKVLIGSYCKQLILGGFNDALSILRRDSSPI